MKLRVSVLLAFRFLKPSRSASCENAAAGTKVKRASGGTAPSNARKSLMGAVFGIGLSLIPLVVVLVVSDGMIKGISSRIIELSSYHLQVIDFSAGSGLSEIEDAAERLRGIPGIENTWIERQGLGLAAGPLGRSGATVRAVEPKLFTENAALASLFTVFDGSLSLPGDTSALIGKKLADTIGVGAGDTVRLITMRTGSRGTVMPRTASFTISGVISSGYQELDALWLYVPLKAGFQALSAPSARTFIGIQTPDPFADIAKLKLQISYRLPASFAVYTWYELNQGQYQSYKTTKNLLMFIMLLIVLVASVNVSSALVMLVMERRREIAILKSVGASPGGITFSFVFAGFFTGLAGLITGMPLGILCAVNINAVFSWFEKVINFFSYFMYILINAGNDFAGVFVPVHLLDPAYYLETIPVELSFLQLFIIAAGILVLSVLVSIGPALRAGAEKPLNSLRKY